MALRLASAELTRLELGEGSWIDVIKDVSRRDFNALMALMPDDPNSEELSTGEANEFTPKLFSIFVKGWSLDEPPTVDSYLKLSAESSLEVDNALVEHMQSLTPQAPKENSQKKSRGSRSPVTE